MLLYFAFKGQDLAIIFQNLASANYWWVIASMILSIGAHYLRAIRWKMLIKPLGFSPSNANTFHAVMIGYLANLAFPRMGEVTRCGVLTKTDKIPINSLIGTVIVERFIDFLTLIALLFFALFIQFDTIYQFIDNIIFTPLIYSIKSSTLLLITTITILFLFLLLGRYLYLKFKDDFTSTKIGNKISNLLIGIKDGFTTISKMEKPWLFYAYSIGIWFFYFITTYLVFFAIPATSNLGWQVAIFVLAAGSLGMVAPVQGGIGAYHWMVAEGLVLFSIVKSDGLIYATLAHSSQVLLILFLGLIGIIATLIPKKLQPEIDDEQE